MDSIIKTIITKKYIISFSLVVFLSLFFLSSCTPTGVVLSAGATAGVAAYEERGIKGAAKDLGIRVEINNRWLNAGLELYNLVSLQVYNDDLDGATSATFNVGLYNGPQAYTISGTTTDAAAVIDEDCYVTLSTQFQGAVTAPTELLAETRNVNAIANFVWEDGGLAEDPGVPLRIAITMSATPGSAAGGDITMVVQYVVD